jgi:hypothetical protein
MTTHTITAVRSGSFNGMDWEAEYVITYDYVPAAPDWYDKSVGGPGGWNPGHGAEISFISATPLPDAGAFTDIAVKELQDWAAEWLDDNYAAAVDAAEQDSQPDPDAAYDAMRDDEMTGHTAKDHGDDW